GGDSFKMRLADQSEYAAKVVGYAPDKDLAVLRVGGAPASKLRPLPVGVSQRLLVCRADGPRSWQSLRTRSLTDSWGGQCLGPRAESTGGRNIYDVIQTDGAINPGNSGGPLLDSCGRLIGVNSAIYSPSGASAGIGFAIPVDTVNRIVPELIRYGKITRPGIGVQAAEDQIAQQLGVKGVLIVDVVAGSAAAK